MWSVGLFLIALAVVSFTHYVHRWNKPKCSNGGRLPPGSMGFPLIGESIQFFIPTKSLDMPGFIKKRIARYGTLFRTSLAGRPIVVSSDPEFNYFIFQQEGKLVQLWYMDSFSSVVGNVFDVTATNYVHKYIKNVVSNHFGTESLKDQLLPKLEAMANQGLQSWSTQSSVELKESIASMIFDLSSKLLFSYDGSKNPNHNMSKMLNNFVQCVMAFPLNIPGTAFHRCLKDQKMAIKIRKDILQEKLTSPEKRYGDFLDQIVADMKKEEFLTEEFVVFLMFGILLTSFEAISSAITVGMTLLTDHPLVVKELIEEHETILKSRKDGDSQLTWKEYKSMSFTSQVINETLRMSSVAPGILRKVIKDIHINGYVIPKGWTIMVVPSALQMNPEKFKDPLVFNPWRWNDIGSNTAVLKSFIPFGGGSRNCAGAEFSRVSMAVFLHVLVTKFSWTKIKGAHLTRTPALSFGDGFYVKVSEKECNEMKENTSR